MARSRRTASWPPTRPVPEETPMGILSVLTGDLTLAIADVDLVHVSLRMLISSISKGQDR
jgi:hypothetical protein